jgi:Holliday junction DNA helicase RuvA
MIASLQGLLSIINDDSIVIQVGGVGLQVSIPLPLLSEVSSQRGEEISLYTYLVVREDSMTLYGFKRMQERRLFEMLLAVSGVGPRTALAVVGTLTPETLANAIHRDEPDIIARVPGLGNKTAQKVILELKGKVIPSGLPEGMSPIMDADTDVLEALTALGYSIVEAQAAIQSIPADASKDIEDRIMIALQYFSG